ncbi:MAG: hypothetical protein VW943_04300, partial [Flavobacteriaceae bacterium]
MKKSLLILFLLGLSFTACSEQDIDDNQINVVAVPTPSDDSGTTSSTTDTGNSGNSDTTSVNTEVNDYIWKGLNLWYYWQEEVDNLADTFDDNQSQYNSFLQSYADPEDFFNNLNHPDDRFSWIDPD